MKKGTTLIAVLPGGVHNKIPEKPSYPYIRIGDANETKFNTFNHKGKNEYKYILGTKVFYFDAPECNLEDKRNLTQ